MYTEYIDFNSLFEAIKQDKEAEGANASNLNRYPVRFVLFDNFKDSYAFALRMIQEMHVQMEKMEKWVTEAGYADILITHQRFADEIEEYIRGLQGESKILAPFSEIARFYDNIHLKEFDVLIRTVKGIETSNQGWDKHQRVYIPIVGLEGKMSPFFKDTQMTIWHLHSVDEDLNYRLILTNQTTYGVRHLEKFYTIVHNVSEWLAIWRKPDTHTKKHLICTSSAIHANSDNARPDNAFSFAVCDTAHDFLIKGLNFPFKHINYIPKDDQFWEELTKDIDLEELAPDSEEGGLPHFSFTRYFEHHFSVSSIDGIKGFMKLWFDYKSDFSRWLLVNTYLSDVDEEDYIGRVLHNLKDYTDQSLFSAFALEINQNVDDMKERLCCLNDGAQRGICLSIDTQNDLEEALEENAKNYGYSNTIKLFSSISEREKRMTIQWLRDGKIKRDDIKESYPELYYYLEKSTGTTNDAQVWALEYIDKYKTAKVTDSYAPIEAAINEINQDSSTFYKWYVKFKTIPQLLNSRGDIEVFYWIDGLGIDWIPLISHIVELRNRDKIYLNEIMIGSALLPTITSKNKANLEKLKKNGVVFKKIGDIDKLAHENNYVYPDNIIHEIEAVCTAVNDILDQYQSKKIAIIADHGLTALAQYQDGLKLKGFTSHHFGRYATKNDGKIVEDNNYFIDDDHKTVFALRHNSLGNKIADNSSAHGGCTPEEVLVPIFIISPEKNKKTWTLRLLNKTLDPINNVLHLNILGLQSTDDPKVIYNGVTYEIQKTGEGIYDCAIKNLDDGVTEIEFIAGGFSEKYTITVKTGATIDDPFASMGF